MLLSSGRSEARLWDVGACRDRADVLWAPSEPMGESLQVFEGVRNAIFRQDGLLVLLEPLLHIQTLASVSLKLPAAMEEVIIVAWSPEKSDEHWLALN
jgi:hypothetical protein